MSSNLKTYKNKDGYTIKATEKAYKLFYEKQGFVEVKESKACKKKEDAEAAEGDGAAPGDSPETPKTPKKKKAE